ncbi:MAG: hypothetical protein QM775_05420 [Pirellulales bacterium]
MRNSRWLRKLLLVCAPALGTAYPFAPATALAQVPTAEAPLYPTRQNQFDIPFQIPAAAPGQEPVEVQLHVSENAGGTWAPYAVAKPEEGRFTFRAVHDGEYWFCVRTLNKAGKLLPESPPSAEMRVLVDTMPPIAKLTCEPAGPNQIRAMFTVDDPLLKRETLELFCRGVDGAQTWKPTQLLDRSLPGQPTTQQSGEALFAIDPSAKAPLYVRVSVADGAGNVAVQEQQIQLPGQSTLNPTALPATTSNVPLGAMPTNPAPAVSANPGPWRPSAMVSQPATTPPREAIGPPPQADGEFSNVPPPSMSRSFPGRSSPPPGYESLPPPNTIAGASGEPIPTGRNTAPFAPTSKPREFATDSGVPQFGGSSGPIGAKGSSRETIGPGMEDELPIPTPLPKAGGASSDTTADAGPRFMGPGLGDASGSSMPHQTNRPTTDDARSLPAPTTAEFEPDGVRPRLVNSRKFELDYDIESVGTAGVARVELFGTRDGGKTWNSLGNDPDSTSPFIVNVDGEGTYGFRMVIESTTGLKGPSPQTGDLPEVWVGVDVTKPTTKLASATPGNGEQAGELDIRWEAADEHLTNRPVALAYSESAQGPWQTIASGLPNVGHYAWRMDSRIPAKLYLKLDVRDEAGNVGTYITPEAVAIERVRPQGRIRGVRPIGDQARLQTPGAVQPR